MTDPHHSRDSDEFDGRKWANEFAHGYEDGSTPSQFPEPSNRQIKGSYQQHEFAPRGEFGPREAGSTLAFSAAIQPAIVYAAYQIEQLAEAQSPEMGAVGAIGVFGAAWGSQFFLAIASKIAAGFLRNFGESLIRDVGAWLWAHVLQAAWDTFADAAFPWRWRTVPTVPEPVAPKRRPLRDWWERRRQNTKDQ